MTAAGTAAGSVADRLAIDTINRYLEIKERALL